jgi:hypothetical protein
LRWFLITTDGSILFRFLTTSERGQERGHPFKGKRGLDYWDTAKHTGIEIGPLRSFLQSQKSLPADLREFLRVSSDEELRERLIKRIEWDTGNKPQPFIEGLINKDVISYGNRVYSLPRAESLKVVPHLLKYALETACQNRDRWLDHPDFMQLFENALTERISIHELQQLRRTSIGITRSATSHMGLSPLTLDTTLDLAKLPVLERLAQRQGLVTSLRAIVNNTGILILKGSTGTGKSTLAGLITAADGCGC